MDLSKNKIIKSVSFNITNPKDEKILKAIKRRNFSGYVKKLIMADIEAREREKAQNEENKAVENDKPKEDIKPTNAAERLQQLKQQQKRPGPSSAPQVFINRPNN
jgi:hypothetical protein